MWVPDGRRAAIKQLTNAQRLRVVLEFENTQNLSAAARRLH
jgi:hypothetical protein